MRNAVFALIAGALLLGNSEFASAAPESEHGHSKEHAGGSKPEGRREHAGTKRADRDKDEDEMGDHEGRPDDQRKLDDKAPPGLVSKDDDRHQRLLARFEERKRTAPQRRQAERDEDRRRWGAAVDLMPARDELKRHARAVARLERVKDVAESEGKAETVARAAAVLEKENARHEKRMVVLGAAPAAPSASGGAR